MIAPSLLHAATGVVLVTALALTAYPVAVRVGAGTRLSSRLSATAIVALWWASVLFYALAAAAAFTLPAVLVTTGGAAALVTATLGRGAALRHARQADAEALRAWWREPWDPLVVTATLAVGGVLLLRLLKGLLSPPLAWDGLTYHLVKAARWVQHGGWAPQAAPDAWRYYEYFPPGGDLLWAWAMLPDHSDGFVAVAGVLLWLTGVLGASGAAQALGASRGPAWTTALALAAMPSVMAFVTSSYVTGPLLAVLLLALTHALPAVRQGRRGDVVLAVAALGVATGIQSLAAPLLAIGLALLVAACAWRRDRRDAAVTLAASLLVCLPMLTGYAVAWRDTGSPLYPLSLTIAGDTVLAGNEQLAAVLSGAHFAAPPAFSLTTFLTTLVDGVASEARDHLNFGAGGVLLVALGVVGLWGLLADRHHRAGLLALAALVAIPVVALAPESMLAQRTFFAPIAGRFLAPSLAAVAVVGARVGGRMADWLRLAAVLVGAWYSWPDSVATVERDALMQLAPSLAAAAGVGGLCLLMWWWAPRRLVIWAGAAVAFALIATGIGTVRASFRHRVYAATGQPQGAPYDVHPIHTFLAAFRVWQVLDGEVPRRVAVTAGWDGFNGHTVFRYPLFGRRLQNDVVYVPPTRTGAVLDYQRLDLLRPHLDVDAWLRRLHEQRVDYVVVAVPGAPELAWMRQHPQVFVPIEENASLWTAAFRVDAAPLGALLR